VKLFATRQHRFDSNFQPTVTLVHGYSMTYCSGMAKGCLSLVGFLSATSDWEAGKPQICPNFRLCEMHTPCYYGATDLGQRGLKTRHSALESAFGWSERNDVSAHLRVSTTLNELLEPCI